MLFEIVWKLKNSFRFQISYDQHINNIKNSQRHQFSSYTNFPLSFHLHKPTISSKKEINFLFLSKVSVSVCSGKGRRHLQRMTLSADFFPFFFKIGVSMRKAIIFGLRRDKFQFQYILLLYLVSSFRKISWRHVIKRSINTILIMKDFYYQVEGILKKVLNCDSFS